VTDVFDCVSVLNGEINHNNCRVVELRSCSTRDLETKPNRDMSPKANSKPGYVFEWGSINGGQYARLVSAIRHLCLNTDTRCVVVKQSCRKDIVVS
jgi:hypothetical protein